MQGSDDLTAHTRLLAATLSVLLAVVGMVIDWYTWIELNVCVVYGIPLVVAAAARSRRLLWTLTAVLVTVTFIVYAQQIPAGAFSPTEPYLVDRVLSAAALLLTALVLHALTLVVDALNVEQHSLQTQNHQLDLANRQLSRYQEEITRQNEELERRRWEAEAASGRKSRMLVTASHDIRTPINAISLMAEVICRSAGNPALAPQIPGLATRLQNHALSLAELVSDVLDTASFDSGSLLLNESEFLLDDLLTEQCARFMPLAEAKNLRLELNLPDRALRLCTDRMKLDRVVSNLVTNAITYTAAGKITVSAGTAQGGAFITVEDTGIGIADDDLQRIFDEFARLRSSEFDRSKGWGLGLAICKRLVEMMGGSIGVESEIDRGSTFSVNLPPDVVLHGPAQGGE